MSTIFSVYLGPFAEWLVPEAKYEKAREKWQALIHEFQAGEGGCLDFDQDSYMNEVVIGRKLFIRECWTAYLGLASTRSGPPPRSFHWDATDDKGVWEFSGFDIEQEKRWFQEAFAQQLKQLAEAYGAEPTIKWGVVTKFS
jgi:hypothetical protein